MKKKKHLRNIYAMENINKTVYIIDPYDKFTLDKIVSVFKINNRWWAIKEVPLKWGIPQLTKIEDDEYTYYHIYETIDEAREYVKQIKRYEGLKI